jgi:hypothetical protein
MKYVIRIMALLVAAAAVYGQETRGTIVGRVTDPTGAVVPAAQVVITNKTMGTKIPLSTNEEGLYRAPLLIAGTYEVVVEIPGFKKFVRDGVELHIADQIEINVQLQIGPSDVSVTVSAETPVLTTETGSLGSVVDSRRIADLPISYGNPFELIGVAAGVTFARDPRLDRPFEPTHIVGFAFDGTRANRSDVTLDGVPSTATANPNEVIATYVPPTDIVAEFKVQTATFDASFGQTEGGVTNISIKSGGNDLHGTGYYSMTRPSLWANDFFANANRQPRADYIFHRWGTSVGGPVWIPKVYRGRNKTFFEWGYEGIHDSRPRNNGTPTVPTVKMKSGDFSELLALGPSYQIYDPFTRTSASGGRIQAQPFTGNIIPANRLNSVGKAILGYWPDPLQAGNSDYTNNYQRGDLVEAAKYYTHTVRIDHNLSDRQRLYGRVSVYRRDSYYNDYFDNAATGQTFQFLSRSGVLDDVISFGASTVLNFRYGYNRFIRAVDGPPAGMGFDITKLGLPSAYNALISEDQRRFPRIDFPANTYQGTGFTGEFRPVDTHSWNATMNRTWRTHNWKTGVEFRAYRENDFFYSNDQTGRFNFDTTWTRGPLDNATSAPNNLGQPVAALLLGLPSATNSYVSRTADYAEQSMSWGLFVQDDWKLTPRLTLNLGVRWEFETPLTERYNKSVKGFDPNYAPPFAAQAIANYARNPLQDLAAAQFGVKGGLTFATASDRGLYETPKRNLMPRVALAYHATPKTVIRAGYGLFYGFLGERRGDVVQHGFTRQTPFNPSSDNGLTYLATLTNPFPTGILEPLGASQGSLTFMGQSVFFFNQKPLQPQMQRWQIGFQREFHNLVLEGSYVGNRGTHIEIQRNLNTTPQQYLGTSPFRDQAAINRLSALGANPFVGLLPAGAISQLTANTIAAERLLRPYPQFDNVWGTTNDGYSWYHGLQLSVERRMAKGFMFAANYTYSKFMQANELLNPSDIRPVEVISDQDYPHRITVSSIFELPFGRGRKWLAGVSPVASKFISGWQLSGIWMFQSGAPINWNLNNSVGQVQSSQGQTGQAQNAISFFGNVNDIGLPSDERTIGRGGRWFNTAAGFVLGSTQQIDINRQLRTFPLRFGFLRADNVNNYDLALIKNTRVAEGKDIQFRAEGLNVLNHALFPAPNTDPTSANFGQVTASTQANYPRRLQLSLKFIF